MNLPACPPAPVIEPARRLLVAYASRSGTTAEVAQAIGRELRAVGCVVDVRAAREVDRVDDYDAVIVGAAVRYGAWLEEALAFLRRHCAALALRPVAFFTLHMQVGADPAGAAPAARAAARALVAPRAEACFLGALLPPRLSWTERVAVRLVGAPLRDLRDWPAIADWARTLPALLLPAPR